MTIITITAFIFVIMAFYTDIRWMIIPNKLNIIAAGVGISVQIYANHWNGIMISILGLSVAFVLTAGLYVIKAVGAGDVKGLAALGAITGAEFTVSVLIIALIYAGVVGILFIIVRGNMGYLIRHWWSSIICFYSSNDRGHLRLIATHRVHSFPFMLAVLPAFITCLLTI